jgi:hypothetical protein
MGEIGKEMQENTRIWASPKNVFETARAMLIFCFFKK